MDFVAIPLTTLSKRQANQLKLVEQFTRATYQLFTGHFKGKDVTTDVMKKLAQRPEVKDPSSIVNLHDFLIEFLFEYHKTIMFNNEQNDNKTKSNRKSNRNSNNVSKSSSTMEWDIVSSPAELFPAWVVQEIRLSVNRMLKIVEKHKAVVKDAVTVGKSAMYNFKKAKSKLKKYEATETVYNLARQAGEEVSRPSGGGEDTKKLKKELDDFANRFNIYDNKYQGDSSKYETIRKEHQEMLASIKEVLGALQERVQGEISNAIQHGIRQLREIGKSMNFTDTVMECLETIDTKTIASEIYYQLCVVYFFPDITKEVVTIGAGDIKDMHDIKALNDVSQRTEDYSSIDLFDSELDDATNLENVYVRVMQKHAKETKTDLKLKSGRRILWSPTILQNDSEGPDMTSQIHRLIWAFADRICAQTFLLNPCLTLTLVEQFTDATYQLFTGHFKDKDMTTEVMQKLTQRPKVQDPSSLLNLHDFLKDFLFEYNKTVVFNTRRDDNNNKNNNMRNRNNSNMYRSARDTIYKPTWEMISAPAEMFPAWVVHEMRWNVDRMLELVEKHKAVVAKAVTLGETAMYHFKRATSTFQKFENIETVYNQARQAGVEEVRQVGRDEDIKKLKKELDVLAKRFNMYDKKYQDDSSKYETIREKHEEILASIKEVLEALQERIEGEISIAVQHGIRQLTKVGKSINMTDTLMERLKTIDTKRIASEIYDQLCVTYFFPKITKEVVTTGAGFIKDMHDKRGLSDDRRVIEEESAADLLDTELVDATELENVYVRVMQNHAKETKTDLKLKSGQIVKQKLCSEDGQTGFGWTRSIVGMKKWGFYQTNVTQFHHSPKKACSSRKPREVEKTAIRQENTFY